jgi:hypothetical protein
VLSAFWESTQDARALIILCRKAGRAQSLFSRKTQAISFRRANRKAQKQNCSRHRPRQGEVCLIDYFATDETQIFTDKDTSAKFLICVSSV